VRIEEYPQPSILPSHSDEVATAGPVEGKGNVEDAQWFGCVTANDSSKRSALRNDAAGFPQDLEWAPSVAPATGKRIAVLALLNPKVECA
jgi:hypothetical protein